MMTNQQLRLRLMGLYGTASAFNLVTDEAAPEVVQAMKETGLQIRDQLLEIIKEIPKEK